MRGAIPLAIIALLLSAGTAQADEALAKSKNCMACHALDTKRVGPSYKEIANRYAGQQGMEARLAETIIKGSKGGWKKELKAELLMPPNVKVNPDDATRIVQWILGLK